MKPGMQWNWKSLLTIGLCAVFWIILIGVWLWPSLLWPAIGVVLGFGVLLFLLLGDVRGSWREDR
jgi:hypothetical protein